MVDESLIAYFKTKVPEVEEETLRNLLGYDEIEHELTELQCELLIKAIFSCKILDPSTGSGAFPMGFLQQMVHILRKLDPNNTHWNNVVMAQAMTDFDAAGELSNDEKENLLAEIEKSFDDSVNYPDYARKLYLIENCIYGVDIQSIAVQICKLRFFISLVCEQNHSDDSSDNFGIRPLPNLETKFVAANTLIGIEKNEEDMALFQQEKILKLVKKLKDVRHRQFLVTNSQKKKELREKDESLRHEIVTEVQKLYVKRADDDIFRLKMQLKQSEKELENLNKQTDIIHNTPEQLDIYGGAITKTINVTENKRSELKTLIALLNKQITEGSKYTRLESVVQLAEQLTSWNPYDQNASSPFFDPEWMFGISEGFDIVSGNPPYVDIKGLPKKDVSLYFKIFQTTENRINLYSIFIEKGISLLNESGILVFINPNSILINESYRKIRKYIIKGVERIIKLPDSVFESATVETIILFAKKESMNKNILGLFFPNREKIDFSNLTFNSYSRDEWLSDNDSRFNIFSNDNISSIINKISLKGTPLEEFVLTSLGITPYDKYRGHSEELIKNKDYHAKSKLNENYVPLISGKNIHRYYISNEIGDYLNYGDWLGAARERKFFENKKIIVRQIVGGNELNIIAGYSETSHYFTQIGFSLISRTNDNEELKYLLSLLNSKLINFYHKNKFLDIEKILFQKILIANCKKLPIIRTKNQNKLIYFIDIILTSKQENPLTDTTYLERQIDELVFKLYDLTYEEVFVVCPDFWLSEEEYNVIEI
jgi:hypothetical protein